MLDFIPDSRMMEVIKGTNSLQKDSIRIESDSMSMEVWLHSVIVRQKKQWKFSQGVSNEWVYIGCFRETCADCGNKWLKQGFVADLPDWL